MYDLKYISFIKVRVFFFCISNTIKFKVNQRKTKKKNYLCIYNVTCIMYLYVPNGFNSLSIHRLGLGNKI